MCVCRECVAGLGERLMREAALILDQNDPEEAEVSHPSSGV